MRRRGRHIGRLSVVSLVSTNFSDVVAEVTPVPVSVKTSSSNDRTGGGTAFPTQQQTDFRSFLEKVLHRAIPKKDPDFLDHSEKRFYPVEEDIFGASHGAVQQGWAEMKAALPIVWVQYVNTDGIVGIEARCMLEVRRSHKGQSGASTGPIVHNHMVFLSYENTASALQEVEKSRSCGHDCFFALMA